MKHLRKKSIFAISVITIIILVYLITHNNFYEEEYENITSVNNFIDSVFNNLTIEESNDYFGILEIPSISLKRELINPDSKENTVNKNIEIIQPSDMPDISNGNMILAGHSGTSPKAYFNNLKKVKTDDLIFIYYNDIKYIYQVKTIYNEIKNGIITFRKDINKTTLTLTTCNKDKQLVITAEQINKEKILEI